MVLELTCEGNDTQGIEDVENRGSGRDAVQVVLCARLAARRQGAADCDRRVGERHDRGEQGNRTERVEVGALHTHAEKLDSLDLQLATAPEQKRLIERAWMSKS